MAKHNCKKAEKICNEIFVYITVCTKIMSTLMRALKLSAIVDQHGMPHGLACHPGNKPDVVLFEPCLRNMLTHLESVPMYADRGYDSRHRYVHHMGSRIVSSAEK